MDALKTVFAKMRAIAHRHYDYHERAMNAAIGMNMHGFKRWHRHASKMAFCEYLHLANDAMNMSGDMASGEYPHVAYTAPSGIQGHLETGINMLGGLLADISAANNEFRAAAGVGLPCAEAMQYRLVGELAKLRRWKQRFEDNKWLPHDIYVFDAALHAKMKGKEESLTEQ